MGVDKASLMVGGRTMLGRVVEAVASVAEEVVVVRRKGQMLRDLGEYKVRDVEDEEPSRGPLGGLVSGLRVVRRERALVVGCDMPFLNPRLLEYLIGLSEGWDVVVPRVHGKPQVLHSVWSKECLSVAEGMVSEGKGLWDVLGSVRVRWVEEEEVEEVAKGIGERVWASFMSVDTPGDWALAEVMVGEGLG
jgi:molybdopterin-guanine dinucleotide biosynthesis protein A